MAGALRAEATLALANALFIAFLLLGGIILPVDRSAGAARDRGRLLPAAALADVFRAALGSADIATRGADRGPVRLGRRRGRPRGADLPLGVTGAGVGRPTTYSETSGSSRRLRIGDCR